MEKKTWEEFRSVGLLWWINRQLHLFGWGIVVELQGNVIQSVFPARVSFRGFNSELESANFVKLADYLAVALNEMTHEQHIDEIGPTGLLVRPSRRHHSAIDEIAQLLKDHDYDDPSWPKEDWRLEVANHDTRLGYTDWVLHQIEANQ